MSAKDVLFLSPQYLLSKPHLLPRSKTSSAFATYRSKRISPGIVPDRTDSNTDFRPLQQAKMPSSWRTADSRVSTLKETPRLRSGSSYSSPLSQEPSRSGVVREVHPGGQVTKSSRRDITAYSLAPPRLSAIAEYGNQRADGRTQPRSSGHFDENSQRTIRASGSVISSGSIHSSSGHQLVVREPSRSQALATHDNRARNGTVTRHHSTRASSSLEQRVDRLENDKANAFKRVQDLEEEMEYLKRDDFEKERRLDLDAMSLNAKRIAYLKGRLDGMDRSSSSASKEHNHVHQHVHLHQHYHGY